MSDALGPLKGLVHRVKGAVSRSRHGESYGLQVVRDPPNADIDIVAVHGLGQDGFRSWTTEDPKSNSHRPWLEELLGSDIPNARIMTYNYVCNDISYRYIILNVLYGRALNLTENLVSQRQRDGTSNRPLFFIAHSLGGWIVKRALILSSESGDPNLRDIKLSTCGVAFFGTISPGRPSSPSPLAHVIRRTSSCSHESKRRAPSMQLQDSDVEWLERQMAAFKGITSSLHKLSFYETKKTEDEFVAERKHSMTSSDGTQIGLASTHSELIKFRGRDTNYKAFISNFRDMVENAFANGLLEARNRVHSIATVQHISAHSRHYEIPYQILDGPEFTVPRKDVTNQIDAVFNPPVSADKTRNFRLVHLWGAEGMGKTTLAKHYAETHRSDFSFVFWISAESWETAVASYLDMAKVIVDHCSRHSSSLEVEQELGLKDIGDMLSTKSILQLDRLRVMAMVGAVKDWLMRPENNDWLVVIDDIAPSYDVQEFIPLTLSGKVVLTSRDVASCAWGLKIEVTAMTEAEAVEQLHSSTEFSPAQKLAEIETAKSIVNRLDCHPLRIAQASLTIRSKQMMLTEYQQTLEQRSRPQILETTIDQFPLTKKILRISSMLSSSAIPTSLFTNRLTSKEVPARFAEAITEMKALQEQGSFEDVFQHLLDMNYIQVATPSDSSTCVSSTPTSSPSSQSSTSTGYFVVDGEARKYVHETMSPQDKAESAWLACNICADGIQQMETDSSTLREVHSFNRVMAPHVKACYTSWSSVPEPVTDSAVAWHVLGNVCMAQGAIDQAIGYFEMALRQGSPMKPLDRIQTALSLSQLLERRGDHKGSVKVLSALELKSVDKALGFRVAFAKASAAAADGQLSDAEYQYETLEHEQEQVLGPAHAETVGTVQMLASTLERLGKPQEAQMLYRRVYLSYQTTFGPDHPMTLSSLDNLANISKAVFAIDDAESLYQKSAEIKSRSLGPTHPRTALAIQNLASIDDVRGRYRAARAKYETALDAMLPTLGRAHPHYVKTMTNMAHSLCCQGQVLEDEDESMAAAASLEESQRKKKDKYDAALHARVRDAMLRDAALRRAFEDAEELYIEIIGIQKAARDMYSDDDVLATGSRLCEMYETSRFFAEDKAAKVDALRKLLREGRRRGTM